MLSELHVATHLTRVFGVPSLQYNAFCVIANSARLYDQLFDGRLVFDVRRRCDEFSDSSQV